MSKDVLNEHYERKYTSDVFSSIESIKTVRIPRTRFEAVANFFPKYFKGGDILEFGAGMGWWQNAY